MCGSPRASLLCIAMVNLCKTARLNTLHAAKTKDKMMYLVKVVLKPILYGLEYFWRTFWAAERYHGREKEL